MWVASAALLALTACDLIGTYPWQVRVPIVDVGAEFTLADATWFQEEETLFIFYRITSREGLSENSVVELTFRTDNRNEPFKDLQEFPIVHTHVPVICGPQALCGSYSTRVIDEPRDVKLQLRYHRDGELVLDSDTAYHVVNTVADVPHENRSALVYGVWDEENIHVQWRLRHVFPAIRNQEAQELGLRRYFRVEDVGWGVLSQARNTFESNPYGYGVGPYECPDNFTLHDNDIVETDQRAKFDPVEFPVPSYDFPHACGLATVIDAKEETGAFYTATAFAQKNPQTRSAFPALQTPITENVIVPVMLQVCNSPTSIEHQEMQMQRLFLNPIDIVCIDDWDVTGFPGQLAARLGEDIDLVRQARGKDMVLVMALNRPDNVDIARAVEEALGFLVPPENEQSSPRLSGVFMFDTAAYTIQDPAVARLVLWCPSGFGGNNLDAIPDASARSCAVQPTIDLPLGEQVGVSQLPILPTEEQYEEFIEEYGTGQAGRMTEIKFSAPTRTPTTDNVPVFDFAVATFFNEEAITPAPGDGFSYCADDDSGLVVFRFEGLELIPDLPQALPLSFLGEFHPFLMAPRYELGLIWDFPFLFQANYESTLAAALNVNVPFIVGFGISSPQEQFFGGFQWQQDEFDISKALEQCTKYCDHPTFDSAGVYNVDDLFVSYAARCYRPRFPELGDGGFPPDP